MKRPLFSRLVAACLLVLFICSQVISQNWLSSLRVDTTQDQLYTLSDDTKVVLAALKQPLDVRLYLSREALTEDPILRASSQRVVDLLAIYEAQTNGLLNVTILDPAPFSAQEEDALKAGLTQIPGPRPDDPAAYFGLVLSSATGRTVVLPLLNPRDEASFEYRLTRAVTKLDTAQPTRVALLTSLPWLIAEDTQTRALRPVAELGATLLQETDLALLSPDFQTIPSNTEVLMVAQPTPLSEAQQFALDQYVLKGGKLLLLLDPASTVAQDGGGGLRQGTQALGRLPQNWGFSVQGDVIADRAFALPVQTGLAGRAAIAPQPLIFQVPASGINQEHAVTRALGQGIHVASPGEVVSLTRFGISFTPLLTSSADTLRLDAPRVLKGPSPQDLELDWQSSGQRQVLAAEVRGTWSTAFPAGDPVNASTSSLKVSQVPGQILVIGDVDLLADSLYVDEGGQVADNARLILNSLDYLAGKQTLLSLRARTPNPRTLVKVDALRQAAQAQALAEEEALASRLMLAEARLQELETEAAAKGLVGADVSTRDIASVRQEVQEARIRLRAVQAGVRDEVAAIKTKLIVITGLVVPLLILLTGLIVYQRRWRHKPIVTS